jgi:hypothetical protein
MHLNKSSGAHCLISRNSLSNGCVVPRCACSTDTVNPGIYFKVLDLGNVFWNWFLI